MASTHLRNGYVVTVDEERRVFTRATSESRATALRRSGRWRSSQTDAADETIDLRGMLATPGLINMHNHHWASLFKNTGEGLLLEPWLDQVTIPLMLQLTNETLRVAAYLGAIEMLRTGTTCSLNHVVNVNDEESFARDLRAGAGGRDPPVRDEGGAGHARPAVLEGVPGVPARPPAGRGARPRRAVRRRAGTAMPGSCTPASSSRRARTGCSTTPRRRRRSTHARAREAAEPEDHEPLRGGHAVALDQGVPRHDGRRRRRLPRATRSARRQLGLHPFHLALAQRARPRRPLRRELRHEPCLERLLVRRDRAGARDVRGGGERRHGQRRRLRELQRRHGRADEVRGADPERHALRPDLHVLGAGAGDGDDQRREGARSRPSRSARSRSASARTSPSSTSTRRT